MSEVERIERQKFNRWFYMNYQDADGRFTHLPRWLKSDMWGAWQAARKNLLDEIDRLREHLQGRDQFIVDNDLWTEFVNTLPPSITLSTKRDEAE